MEFDVLETVRLFWPLIGITLSAGTVLLLRDWRFTVSALMINYICVGAFVAQQQAIVPSLLVEQSIGSILLVKLITGFVVTIILTVTALTFSRDYGLEDLDEFGLAELRRAARAAQTQQDDTPFRFGDYTVAFWALVLALVTSLTLVNIYPLAVSRSVDFAWYWLGLTGLFTLATANDLLKIGMGLLLSTTSMDLLYTAVVSTPDASGIGVVPLGLLSLVTILLALAIAYLCGLLYGRLKTLDLSELYRQIRG
jgi:TRAP-type C4-dicarboxylate transport system permease large subunit